MSKRKREPAAHASSTAIARTDTRDGPPVARLELIAILAILALGMGLRWWRLDQASVEHFDEGVYASKIFFGPNGTWPMQHLYAPPLLPLVIENLMLMFGISSLAAVLPSLVCGTATIPLLWWIGRTWFNPGAGLSAALLAATSEVHALFSRAALTDVPLTFFLLAALFAWERGVTRQSIRWIVGAGLLTGLAGLTKYNGWLPIGIAGLTSFLWLGTSRWRGVSTNHPAVSPARFVSSSLAMLLIAFSCWAPYLWQLRSQGGYAAVAKNHAKYVVGISGWGDSVARQVANHLFMESWMSCVGLAAAWLLLRMSGAPLSEQGEIRRENALIARIVGESLILAAAAAWIGTAPLVVVGGIAFAAYALRRPHVLSQWLVLAAWLLLLVLTPLYYPYARLTLPLLAIAWLAATVGAQQALIDGRTAPRLTRLKVAISWLLAGAAGMLLAALIAPRFLKSPTPWQPRTGMQRAAEQFADVIRQQQALDDRTQPREPAIFVFGEPALVFHLRSQGFDVVTPVQEPAPRMKNADLPTARVWLVMGLQADRDPAYTRRWPEYREIWRLRDRTEVSLSDIMLLDLFNPLRFAWNTPPREAEMRLYVWRPED